jgi:multidrug resistance protein, MATE family
MISYKEHGKGLLKLGFPLIVGQLGMLVMGLADTLMVGHFGSAELAAAGFVNAIFALVAIFSLGFTYGLTPVVGARYGQGDSEGIGRVLKGGWGVYTLAAVGITVVVLGFYFCIPYLGQPQELLPLIKPYFLIQMGSIPFMVWFGLLKQFSDGVADTRTPMWVMLFGDALNIFGNWLLIYGNWGCPRLGLAGAGWATFASRGVSLAVLAYLFFCTRHYEVYRNAMRKARFLWDDFFMLNRMGWPIALQMGMETASFSVASIFLGWIGTTALAAHQIMVNVGSLCFMIYYGIGAAVAVRISHFSGRGETVEVRRTANAGMVLIFSSGLVMSLLVFACRHYLGGWFTDDARVEQVLLTLMLPFLLYQLGDSMQTNFANSLRGIGDVKPLMRFAFIAYIVVSLPASYLFGIALHGGARGVWLGFPLGLTTAGVLFMIRFYRSIRKRTV